MFIQSKYPENKLINALAQSVCTGILQIRRSDGTPLNLKSMLYVRELLATLISVSQITKSNCAVLFDHDGEAGAYVYRKIDGKLMSFLRASP